jgi:riboflavin synthase
MFTGLVEGKGKITEILETNGGKKFKIRFEWKENDLKLGDSISISGACQTVTDLSLDRNEFSIYSSYKTLELTNLGELQLGSEVNLERSVTPNTRMGGHYVLGHVDGTGKICYMEKKDQGLVFVYHIEFPNWMDRYIAERGSIAVDGISLTVVSFPGNNIFELVLIPETLQKTVASDWKIGTSVNLEVDLIARYLEKMK